MVTGTNSKRRLMVLSALHSTVALALSACGGSEDTESTAATAPAGSGPSPSPATTAINVVDGDFAAWTQFSVITDDPYAGGVGPKTSTGSASRLATGGSPGAYYSIAQNAASRESVWTGGVKGDFVYDPAVSGAIRSLSVSLSLFQPTNAFGEGAIWHLVVEQANRRYYTKSLESYLFIGLWAGASDSNLSASSFDTNPFAGVLTVGPEGNSPNFSARGQPMKFGVVIGTSGLANGINSSIHAIDNFSLTISR